VVYFPDTWRQDPSKRAFCIVEYHDVPWETAGAGFGLLMKAEIGGKGIGYSGRCDAFGLALRGAPSDKQAEPPGFKSPRFFRYNSAYTLAAAGR